MQVVYSAAHGGFAREAVPLGGGAAVFEHLTTEWHRTNPFRLHEVTPAILGASAPTGRNLVDFSEGDYARFCRAFEKASTEVILRLDPAQTAVLINDVSEGPDFAALAARRFPVFTIYHVDVVAYVADIYFKGWLRPETTVRWHRRLRPFLPAMARLVWEKQESSVRHSTGLIVPSPEMRETILRCYPWCPAEKIHVLPWGAITSAEDHTTHTNSIDSAALRGELGIPNNAQVLLTLSRISPEKGQDLLLNALLEWEARADYPSRPLWLVICGDAAYMQGRRHLEKLKALAAKLQRTRVVFAGHVTGARKQAMFSLADLYIFPSKHESYGLTLLEALASGLPAVCVDHHGARSVMREEFGRMVPPTGLRTAIAEMLSIDNAARCKMGDAARAFAGTQRFSDSAAKLAALLLSSLA
ncbi:MAG: glycosyltransferase family 4 protein [Bryobacteraceae bacterium]